MSELLREFVNVPESLRELGLVPELLRELPRLARSAKLLFVPLCSCCSFWTAASASTEKELCAGRMRGEAGGFITNEGSEPRRLWVGSLVLVMIGLAALLTAAGFVAVVFVIAVFTSEPPDSSLCAAHRPQPTFSNRTVPSSPSKTPTMSRRCFDSDRSPNPGTVSARCAVIWRIGSGPCESKKEASRSGVTAAAAASANGELVLSGPEEAGCVNVGED